MQKPKRFPGSVPLAAERMIPSLAGCHYNGMHSARPKTRSIGSICDCSWRPVCRRRERMLMLSKQPSVFPACCLAIPVLELIYCNLDVFWYKVAQFILHVYGSSRGQSNHFNFVQTDVIITVNSSKTYLLLIHLLWTQALITISRMHVIFFMLIFVQVLSA